MPRKPIQSKAKQPRETGITSPIKQLAESNPRTLLLHFHIFKNGGSTLDAALKKNFGDKWRALEGPDPNDSMDWASAIDLITLYPRIEAFSSHTARLPAPQIESLKFVPLFLLRHPIDRIASIYYHKLRSSAQSTNPTQEVAQSGTLADFVAHVLTKNNCVGCDAQTSILSRAGVYYFPPSLSDLSIAKAIVTKTLVPGVIEKMEQYLVMLEKELAPNCPNLDLACADENCNPERKSTLLERLREIRSLLPAHLWNQLREHNRLDLELWRFTGRLAREKFLIMPEHAKRLNDFRRRKKAAHRLNRLHCIEEPIVVYNKGDPIAKNLPRAELAPESGINCVVSDAAKSDAGYFNYTQQLVSQVKSLIEERNNLQKNLAQLSTDYAERTTWALSLDAELQQARSALTQQSQLVEDRTAWAQSLDQELQAARSALATGQKEHT